MKKILILLLVLSVILGTAACGAASKEPEATPVPATEAPVPAEAAPAPEATPEPVPETTPEPTPEATPEPTPTPSPAALLGPVISVSGERYPETLTAGKKFGIKGIVSASSGVLTEVYAKVTDSNGKIAISSQIYRPNKPTLDIHETINNDLSFGQLGAGTYTYTVTATADDSGRKTTTDIIVRQFTVKEYAAAPIADQATDTAIYKSVLDAYSRAFSEGWDRQTLEDNGLNSFYGLSDAGSRLNEIGYAFLDLDSNGTDELILGYVADGPKGNLDDIYAIINGQPVHAVKGWERNLYWLGRTGVIYNRGSGGAAYTLISASYFSTSEPDYLLQKDFLYSDVDSNGVYFWQYFNHYVEPFTGVKTSSAYTTEARAAELMDIWGADTGVINYTPFSQYK